MGYVQLVWYVLSDVKVCEGLFVLLERWKKHEKEQGAHCCSFRIDMDWREK